MVFSAAAAPIWSDEFNGTEIDHSTWTYDVGGHGFGNGQLEYNTARRENSYVTNGSLVIEARRESYSGEAFTSARMLTQGRFAFKYGTLEARIKLPNTANGLWPAFWMMGNNLGGVSWPACGEVDILEMGSKEGIEQGAQQKRINCAVHYSNPQNTHSYYAGWTNSPVDLSLDYHVYKMVWTPANISFYLDESLYGSFDITAPYLTEFHQPHFLILNLAVGGYERSYTGVHSPSEVSASFPGRMYVDYLRLYSNEHTEIFKGDSMAETGNFGVYTETAPVRTKLAYVEGSEPGFDQGTNAALYLWNNMTRTNSTAASEGKECWAFNVGARQWFGMGVLVPNFRNMKNYAQGSLHFDIKVSGVASLKVGIKSSRGGEAWLPLGTDQESEFGFARDGHWHSLRIPLNRFADIDFRTMHQLFMLAGEAPASAMTLSIDNVWWETGGPFGAPLEHEL